MQLNVLSLKVGELADAIAYLVLPCGSKSVEKRNKWGNVGLRCSCMNTLVNSPNDARTGPLISKQQESPFSDGPLAE